MKCAKVMRSECESAALSVHDVSCIIISPALTIKEYAKVIHYLYLCTDDIELVESFCDKLPVLPSSDLDGRLADRLLLVVSSLDVRNILLYMTGRWGWEHDSGNDGMNMWRAGRYDAPPAH